MAANHFTAIGIVTSYHARLSKLNEKAGQQMAEYVAAHGTEDGPALIAYAHALVTKYGEGSAELACQMYEALAEAQGVYVPAAEPAATASYGEVARMVSATKDQNPANLPNGISRLVKRAGADTTLKNAIRDGAEWAWVPHGDTCPFCITLASNGWQKASQKLLKGGHAEHIHANCDCEFAVRFRSDTTVAGYDPDKYYRQYREAGGDINKMRRIDYAANRERINAQKRAAYAARKLSTNEENTATIKVKTSSSRQFVSEQLFQKHYDKHLSEFGEISKGRYLEKANALADAPLSEDIVQLVRSDGSIAKYCYSTNEFVVVTADGNIRTYFKPETKEAYWDEEIDRNK